MPEFLIKTTPLDAPALSHEMENDAAGAFVSFEGWVRNHNEGLSVEALEYEVFHGLAKNEGEKVLAEACEKFGLIDARAIHREGKLAIGDCAVWTGVLASHRGAAFDACRYIIDELKHRLPIWKKEHYTNQTPEWVNCKHQHHHTPPPAITSDDYYARQMILPQIGENGQKKLGMARMLIVGAGGLGSAAAQALAGAGIGTIGIADHDTLSASNLHRQVLYRADDIGKPKAHLAAARIAAQNPLIDVHVHTDKVTADNAETLFAAYDLVLDCTDNFTAKYLLNDVAILTHTPLVQASIYQFEGQLLTINPHDNGGCLRCLFPEAPEPGMVGDCATAGVLGTVPMLFGTMQGNEAIKYILGLNNSPALTTFDLLSLQGRSLPRTRNETCPLCGDHSSMTAPEPNIEYIAEAGETIEDLDARFTLIDVREEIERHVTPLEKSLHMPMSAFDLNALTTANDTPLLVICAHGIRSLHAAKALREAGWTHVQSLSGGLSDGLAEGLSHHKQEGQVV